jgi:hypothetical protein
MFADESGFFLKIVGEGRYLSKVGSFLIKFITYLKQLRVTGCAGVHFLLCSKPIFFLFLIHTVPI